MVAEFENGGSIHFYCAKVGSLKCIIYMKAFTFYRTQGNHVYPQFHRNLNSSNNSVQYDHHMQKLATLRLNGGGIQEWWIR